MRLDALDKAKARRLVIWARVMGQPQLLVAATNLTLGPSFEFTVKAVCTHLLKSGQCALDVCRGCVIGGADCLELHDAKKRQRRLPAAP